MQKEFKKENFRLEIVIPKEGPYPFIKIPTDKLIGITNGYKLGVRIAEGHSFISGYDVPLFDGTMQLEVNAEDSHNPPEVGILLGAFLVNLKRALPRQMVEWEPEKNMVKISLLESCEISVDQSSKRFVADIAKAFSIPEEDLTDQLVWERKPY